MILLAAFKCYELALYPKNDERLHQRIARGRPRCGLMLMQKLWRPYDLLLSVYMRVRDQNIHCQYEDNLASVPELSKFLTPLRQIMNGGLLIAQRKESLIRQGECKVNRTPRSFRFGAAIFFTAASVSTNAAPCLLSDISLTINSAVYSPTACSDGLAQGGGSAVETNALTAALGAVGFIYLDKSDDPATPVGIGGVTFVVGADTGNSGSWTMSWAEQAGAPNLPLMIDLAIGLFGGGNGSGYLFEDVLLTFNPTNASGSYDINFLNSAGREPNLGHLLLAGNASETHLSVSAIPEPATSALLGLGLGGLGFSRRRQ